ncbi:DUF916 and DUF3324 domain-containing protein [Enterococcus gilvus]|uniref:DUF916 and DUF3324 domain-containing protein n=1 Tax=Enterococcus gilvus TaxID=160453 RepID=UPI003ED9344C
MRKKRILILSCLVLLLPFVLDLKIAHGSENDIGFNIRMIPNEYQYHQKNSFFDLRLNPNQEDTIELEVNNTSDKENKFEIKINQAYTNNQGFIDYSDSKEAKKNNYPIDINKITSYPHEIVLKAHESVRTQIKLNMPEKRFNGQILAGIKVSKKETQQKKGTIQNRYGYILGLKITETDEAEPRKIELEKIYPGSAFGVPAVIARLKNTSMDAIGQLTYHVLIKKQGSDKVVLERTYDKNMEMAPNSLYNFAIEYKKDQPLNAGNYFMHLIITDKKNNRWEFNKEFSLSNPEARDVDKDTKTIGESDSYFWIYLIIILLLLTCLIVFIRRKLYKKG